MSTELATTNTNQWADVAKESEKGLIRGDLHRFADWRWVRGKSTEPLKEGARKIATGVVRVWVKFTAGKPDYRVAEPGRPMCEREELDDVDPATWPMWNGEPRDPWQNTRLVYLADPETAAVDTFTTSSWGGRGAVTALGDAVARMQSMKPGALPVVELCAEEMVTKFGKKSKPHFKIISWILPSAAPAIEQEPDGSVDDMNDAIPW